MGAAHLFHLPARPPPSRAQHTAIPARTRSGPRDPWEIYRDAAGEWHDYGHPIPVSEEAARTGIAGLSAELWCPHCDRIPDLVVVEFERPAASEFEAWGGGARPKEG